MLDYLRILTLSTMALLMGQAIPGNTNQVNENNDSLNMCCVGNWSSKTAWTLAYDKARELLFLGSCGCVCILDVSDPTEIREISQFKHSPCNTCGLFYDHSTYRLYICDGISGLKIWDISDVSQPLVLGQYDTPGYASSVYVSGIHAHVADADGGLIIIDVTDPSRPQKVSHHEMTTACHVFVSDNYAFVADLGLRIIDISVPSQPKEVSYYNTPGVAYGVYVVGHHAYIADDWCGLRIMDISNPEYPEELGHLVTPGYAWGVHVVGSYAYVSACEAGLRIIDVSQPENPNEVAYYDTPDEALYAYVSDNHVYVADAAKGLQIYAHLLAGRDR